MRSVHARDEEISAERLSKRRVAAKVNPEGVTRGIAVAPDSAATVPVATADAGSARAAKATGPPRAGRARGIGTLAATAPRSSARRPTETTASSDVEAIAEQSQNVVRIVGRLGVGLRELVLPSGDPVVSFHVVVSRPPRSPREHERRPREPTVDTLACAAWTSRARRTVTGATPGDLLEVEGALRRRFRRSTGGSPVSFYEIEVSRMRRLRASTG